MIENFNELTKAADTEYIRKFEVCGRVADDVVTEAVAKGTV